MSEELYWDANLSGAPELEQVRRLVSRNVEEALVAAFDRTKVWLQIDDKGEAVLTVVGTDDPRTMGMGSNKEDLFNRNFSLREVILKGLRDGDEALVKATEAALKSAIAEVYGE